MNSWISACTPKPCHSNSYNRITHQITAKCAPTSTSASKMNRPNSPHTLYNSVLSAAHKSVVRHSLSTLVKELHYHLQSCSNYLSILCLDKRHHAAKTLAHHKCTSVNKHLHFVSWSNVTWQALAKTTEKNPISQTYQWSILHFHIFLNHLSAVVV